MFLLILIQQFHIGSSSEVPFLKNGKFQVSTRVTWKTEIFLQGFLIVCISDVRFVFTLLFCIETDQHW